MVSRKDASKDFSPWCGNMERNHADPETWGSHFVFRVGHFVIHTHFYAAWHSATVFSQWVRVALSSGHLCSVPGWQAFLKACSHSVPTSSRLPSLRSAQALSFTYSAASGTSVTFFNFSHLHPIFQRGHITINSYNHPIGPLECSRILTYVLKLAFFLPPSERQEKEATFYFDDEHSDVWSTLREWRKQAGCLLRH